MTEATYYKIKLAVTETQLIRLQAEQVLLNAIERQRKVFAEAGLDPQKQYQFNDTTQDITEVKE